MTSKLLRTIWAIFTLACILAPGTLSWAALITKQEATWDTDWLPTTLTILPSEGIFGLSTSAWKPNGWIPSQHSTVGDLSYTFSGSPQPSKAFENGAERYITLGPGVPPSSGQYRYDQLYSEIELGWGTVNGAYRGFKNSSGDDLAIYENGPGILNGVWRSEVFLVSLGYIESGTLRFTEYFYIKPESYEPSVQHNSDGNITNAGNGPTYLTLIDATDLGVPSDAWIVTVRIRNAVYQWDWAKSDLSQNNIHITATVLGVNRENPPEGYYWFYDNAGNPYVSGRYDPDITVVAPLRPVTVIPEPGILTLATSGLLSVADIRALSRRRKSMNSRRRSFHE